MALARVISDILLIFTLKISEKHLINPILQATMRNIGGVEILRKDRNESMGEYREYFRGGRIWTITLKN